MKRGLIIGLIGVSLFTLSGCTESSKEVIIESNEEENKEIVVQKIENEKKEVYYPNSYLNGECYFAKEIKESESAEASKLFNGLEENLYKLNKDNKFEKTDKKLSFIGRKLGMLFIDTEKDSPITKVRYFNNETGVEKIFDLDPGEKINSSINLVEGKEMVSYITQRDVAEENFLQIIDIETNKGKKVDKVFEKPIVNVIYSDSYYVIDDGFKLYKLKEEDKVFKVEETIDLMKEFNIKLHNNGFFVGRIFLKENGEVYLEGIDNESGKDHTDSCGQAFFRYNLKTKEKGRLDYKLEKNMFITDYSKSSDYIILESFDNLDKGISNERLYVGKVSNDKIEIIEEINMKKGDDILMNVEAMFNDKGDEAIIHYTRVVKKDSSLDDEYFKIKIK